MQFRVVSLVLPLLFVGSALAQNKAVPHAIYADGVLVDVVYDVTGMQSKVRPYVRDDPKVVASQNSQSLRMAASEIDGTPKTPSKWSIHRCLPSGPGLGGGQVSCVIRGVQALTLPGLDVAASQAAFFGIDLNSSDVSFDGFFQTTPAEKAAVKEQKKWLPANFRLKIGDLPCDRVSRVDQITIERGVADWDGDGVLDYGIRDSIKITLPVDDAGKFQEWFNAAANGANEMKNLSLEYQDDTSTTFLTLGTGVQIESIGFSDLFLGTTATPGRDVTVTLKAKGIISVKSGTGSGG